MQFPAVAKPPVGVVFDSAMERIDDVLALAMLHGMDGKDGARIAAVGISRPDLEAARFCDAVRMFYASATTGPAAAFMHSMPIGLADGKPAAPQPMLQAAREQKSGIQSIDDTADSGTLIRNVLMAQYDQNAVIVLSGPATDLARLLEMNGVRDWIARKVRVLCLAEPGMQGDVPAARRVFAEWPTPIVAVGREIGEALPFPAESIQRDFAWSTTHPIVAAYRAYKAMPYDAPSWAMAALLYAVRPTQKYFKLSEPGTLAAASDGRISLAAGGQGRHRTLIPDPEQKDAIIHAYIELASAKPVPRKPRHPVKDEKKDEKDEKKDEKKDQR